MFILRLGPSDLHGEVRMGLDTFLPPILNLEHNHPVSVDDLLRAFSTQIPGKSRPRYNPSSNSPRTKPSWNPIPLILLVVISPEKLGCDVYVLRIIEGVIEHLEDCLCVSITISLSSLPSKKIMVLRTRDLAARMTLCLSRLVQLNLLSVVIGSIFCFSPLHSYVLQN